MDRVALEAALAHAENQIAACEQITARQKKIIVELELVGGDTTSERLVLAQLKRERRDRIERRDILRLELNVDWT
jgi:hypothetical protein